MSDDDRIEIELTSHAPDQRRRSPDHLVAGARATPPGGDGDGDPEHDDDGVESRGGPGELLASDRGRLMVTAAAVGVVALLLGWMLGRSGADDAAPAVDDGPTTTAERDDDSPFGSAPTLPEADIDVRPPRPTVTTIVPRTTPPTTTIPVPQKGIVAVDERLDGIDASLVGIDSSSQIVEVDLDAGTTVTGRYERYVLEGEWMIAGDGWIAAPNYNDGSISALFPDGTARDVPGPPWQVLYDETTGRFWSSSSEDWNVEREISEVDVVEGPTGRSVTLPPGVWPVGVVDRDVYASAAGTIYRVRPAGAVEVGRGDLYGATPSTLVTFGCDEELQCGIRVTDLDTGEIRRLPETDAAVTSYSGWFGRSNGGALSPDGRWMLAVVGGQIDLPTVGVLDLESGEFSEFTTGGSYVPNGASWDPTSRFVLYLDVMTPTAYDVTTGETFPIFPEGDVAWRSMTVRSVPSAVAEE